MKTTTILVVATIVALILLLSCNRKAKTSLDDNAKRFAVSEEVSLKLNEKGSTADGNFMVKPLSAKDSRCPKGVQCIRAGEVFVELWMKTANKEETIKMATPSTKKMGGMDQIMFDGYSVKLVNVLPYPEQPKPENVAETTVVLVVEKKM